MARAKKATTAPETEMKVPETVPAAAPVLIRLVILAYPGTLEMMDRIWRKHCSEPFLILPASDGGFTDSLMDVVADNRIADDFVILPANAIPCAPIRFEELQQPFAVLNAVKDAHFLDRLPISFNKAILAETLDPDVDPETFVAAYVKAHATRPVQVSFHFGNYVTPVLRGNPCEHLVIEALIRKKFVVTNEAGWTAIEPLLEKTLLK